MILLRLIALFVIFYIVFTALKGYFSTGRRKTAPPSDTGEPMLLDPQCQTYVPKSAAIFRDGKYFCSEECARLFLDR